MLDGKILSVLMGLMGGSGGTTPSANNGAIGGAPANPQMPAVESTPVDPRLATSGPNSILGMSPTQFMSVMGQVGNAMAPETPMGRLGTVAANMGMAQLQGLLAKNQQAAFNDFAKESLKSLSPSQMGTLSSGLGKLSQMPPDWLKGNTTATGG